MDAIILADKWVEAICKAEGIQWDRTTRIIIDCKVAEPVKMYITQLGTNAVLELLPPEVQEPEIIEPPESGGKLKRERGSSDSP